MKGIIAVCALLLAAGLTGAEPLPSAFNGEDFTGWKVPEENLWWTIADGELRVENDPERQGSTLWTEAEYSNFIMEFDFKFGDGTVDSGIFVRTKSEQIQLGISGSLMRDMTASPYISGKGYPVEAEGVADLLKEDDWNQMTIVVQGNDYVVWLNDKLVMTYESNSDVRTGPVGIQLHGNRTMAISFRDIRIAELD